MCLRFLERRTQLRSGIPLCHPLEIGHFSLVVRLPLLSSNGRHLNGVVPLPRFADVRQFVFIGSQHAAVSVTAYYEWCYVQLDTLVSKLTPRLPLIVV